MNFHPYYNTITFLQRGRKKKKYAMRRNYPTRTRFWIQLLYHIPNLTRILSARSTPNYSPFAFAYQCLKKCWHITECRAVNLAIASLWTPQNIYRFKKFSAHICIACGQYGRLSHWSQSSVIFGRKFAHATEIFRTLHCLSLTKHSAKQSIWLVASSGYKCPVLIFHQGNLAPNMAAMF